MLTEAQKKHIARLLLACSSLFDDAERNAIIGELPFGNKVKGSANPARHILNLVTTCLDDPRRLELLIDVLSFAEGGSTAFAKVLAVLDKLMPLHISWQMMALLRELLALHPLTDNSTHLAYIQTVKSSEDLPNDVKSGDLYLFAVHDLLKRNAEMVLEFLLRCLPDLSDTEAHDAVYGWINTVANDNKINVTDLQVRIQQGSK